MKVQRSRRSCVYCLTDGTQGLYYCRIKNVRDRIIILGHWTFIAFASNKLPRERALDRLLRIKDSDIVMAALSEKSGRNYWLSILLQNHTAEYYNRHCSCTLNYENCISIRYYNVDERADLKGEYFGIFKLKTTNVLHVPCYEKGFYFILFWINIHLTQSLTIT